MNIKAGLTYDCQYMILSMNRFEKNINLTVVVKLYL